MTKAEIVNEVAKATGIEKATVQIVVESFMESVKVSLAKGNPVYLPAKAELARHGIDCTGKRAVQLQKDDYGKYDIFIGMDNNNIRNIHKIFGCDPQNKVCKLMDFTGRGGDVADPWYSNRFDVAYKDIYDGCAALFEYLEKNKTH